MRNEILEAGQEVILYIYTNWRGRIRGTGILVNKLETSGLGSELWRITGIDNIDTEHFIARGDIWWLGKVDGLDESNVKAKE